MLNKWIGMGRLTKDPEMRSTASGTSVTTFTIACDNGYGDNKKTAFINCVAWGKTAEFVSNYFTKGKLVAIVGQITTRSWEGTDGKKNYATEILVQEIEFAESKKTEESTVPELPEEIDADDDDLPF